MASRLAFTLGTVVVLCAWAWAPARALLAGGRASPTLRAVTTLALSTGGATLSALWLLVLRPGQPWFWPSLIACAALALSCWLRPARRWSAVQARPTSDGAVEDAAPDPVVTTSRWLVGFLSVCILFNAVYWPFEPGDALAIYAPFGRAVLETARLPAGEGLYEAYPMLVPLLYAFGDAAWGGPAEHVARGLAGLLALGSVGATVALGTEVAGRRTGWLAGALLATTPVFGRWASSGYTEVPASCFVALSAAFSWRWWRGGARPDAALAGLSAGLAMWTKNAALTLAASIALVGVARMLVSGDGRGPARYAWWLVGAAAAVAAPWYVRNLLAFGHVVPDTVWIEQAPRDVASWFALLRPDFHFGVPGVVFTLGVIHAAIAVARGADGRQARLLLFAYLIPFLLAWWALAGYDARFLVMVLPLFAVLGSLFVRDVADAVASACDAVTGRRLRAVALGVLVVLALPAARKTVEHKGELLARPFATQEEKRAIRLGGLVLVRDLIASLPERTRVAGVPPMLRYHLATARTPFLEFGDAMDPVNAYAGRADVVVYRIVGTLPAWLASRPLLLSTDDGYVAVKTEPGVGEGGPH